MMCYVNLGAATGRARDVPSLIRRICNSWKYGVRLILYDSSKRGRGPLGQTRTSQMLRSARIERIMYAVLKCIPSPF
jgi:hypothetical protein